MTLSHRKRVLAGLAAERGDKVLTASAGVASSQKKRQSPRREAAPSSGAASARPQSTPRSDKYADPAEEKLIQRLLTERKAKAAAVAASTTKANAQASTPGFTSMSKDYYKASSGKNKKRQPATAPGSLQHAWQDRQEQSKPAAAAATATAKTSVKKGEQRQEAGSPRNRPGLLNGNVQCREQNAFNEPEVAVSERGQGGHVQERKCLDRQSLV